jgi:hypothetical protein
MALIIRALTEATVPDGSAQRIPVLVRNVLGTPLGQAEG